MGTIHFCGQSFGGGDDKLVVVECMKLGQLTVLMAVHRFLERGSGDAGCLRAGKGMGDAGESKLSQKNSLSQKTTRQILIKVVPMDSVAFHLPACMKFRAIFTLPHPLRS